MEAGDPVCNTFLTLETQLKSVQKNHYQEKILEAAASPRVQPIVIPAHTPPLAPALKVEASLQIPPTYTSTSILQLHSKDPKNTRFQNKQDHRYPFRSQSLPKRCLRPSTSNIGTNIRHRAAEQLLDQHLFQYNANHIYRENSTKEKINSVIHGPTRHVWENFFSNEWGRLLQGNTSGVRHTDTIDFVHKHEVPRDRDVTY